MDAPPALGDQSAMLAKAAELSEEAVRCRGCYREFHEACTAEFQRCPWTSCKSEERLPLKLEAKAQMAQAQASSLKVLLPEQSSPASEEGGDEEAEAFASSVGFDPEREALLEDELLAASAPGAKTPQDSVALSEESAAQPAAETLDAPPETGSGPSVERDPEVIGGAAESSTAPLPDPMTPEPEDSPSRELAEFPSPPATSEASPDESPLELEREPDHLAPPKPPMDEHVRSGRNPGPGGKLPSRERARKRASRIPMMLTAALAALVLGGLFYWIDQRSRLPDNYLQDQLAAEAEAEAEAEAKASRAAGAASPRPKASPREAYEGALVPDEGRESRWRGAPPAGGAEDQEGEEGLLPATTQPEELAAEAADDEATRYAFGRQLEVAASALGKLGEAHETLKGFERSLQFSERYQERFGGIADDVERNRATVRLKAADRNLQAEQYRDELEALRKYVGPAYAGLLSAYERSRREAQRGPVAPKPALVTLVLKHLERTKTPESLAFRRERWLADLAAIQQ